MKERSWIPAAKTSGCAIHKTIIGAATLSRLRCAKA
jgi:hypothetical protein